MCIRYVCDTQEGFWTKKQASWKGNVLSKYYTEWLTASYKVISPKMKKMEKKFSILLQHLKKANNPAEMEKSLKKQKICR